jgi:hypothetical protein
MPAKWRPRTAEEQIKTREAQLRNLEKARAVDQYMYAEILTALRERYLSGELELGTLAKIADLTDGTKDQLVARRKHHSARAIAWLNKKWPLEKWLVHTVPIPDAWKGYELWVEYLGTAENAYQKKKWRESLPYGRPPKVSARLLSLEMQRRTHPELY